MSIRGARRDLGNHPRLLVAVLLAFALELVGAGPGVISHRHAGGDVVHSHATLHPGPAAALAPIGHVAAVAAIGNAAGLDLHQHLMQPMVAVRGAEPAAHGPVVLVTLMLLAAARWACAPALHPGRARSPPFRA